MSVDARATALSPGSQHAGPRQVLVVSPDSLIRTMSGHITAWSPGLQRRYGFTDAQAHGRTSHHLLRTVFPQTLQDIEARLRFQNSWRGGLIHRHADGRAIMAVNHWHMHRGPDESSSLVTEVHSDIAHEEAAASRDLADVLAALAQELSEPLTAINHHVADAQLVLRQRWPDLEHVREAMTQAARQIARAAESVSLLRHLANEMRDNGTTQGSERSDSE